MHKLAHPDGEAATSKAAASQGICMGLSSYSTTSLEDVALQGTGNPYFVQICVLKDRRTTLQLLKRAESEYNRRKLPSFSADSKLQNLDTRLCLFPLTSLSWGDD